MTAARSVSCLSAILALLCLGVLGAMTLADIAGGPDGPRAEREAATPVWPRDRAGLLHLPGTLRFYLARRYAGYAVFKGLQSGVMLDVFGRSAVPMTMIGTDGWLFLDNDAALATSLGRAGDVTARAADWARGLDRIEARLAAEGIAFHLLIAPNKHSVATAHLPGWAPAPGGMILRDEVLAARGGRDADLARLFRETGAPSDFYHATDTHWSEAGASAALDAALGPLPRPPSWHPAVRAGGDLARSLGLAARLPETLEESDLSRRVRCTTPDGATLRPEPIDPLPQRRFTCVSDAPSGRAVVHMDSFGMNAVLPLAARFSETLFLWDKHVDPAAAADWGADRLFLILAERALLADAPDDVLGAAR